MISPEATDSVQVTRAMLADLPDPARRYLEYAGVVGRPWISTARVRYTGHFRLGANRPWMPMQADQVYVTTPPAFRWRARFKMLGMWCLRGTDTFKEGHGHMSGKVARLLTVFDERGDELDQATMLRYLNETMWFPAALLSNHMSCHEVDAHSFDVTFSFRGRSVRGRFLIDSQGQLRDFVADRYREHGGTYSLDPWETPVMEYGKVAGLNLPVHGRAVWRLSAGDLPYADLKLVDVEYNQPIEAF